MKICIINYFTLKMRQLYYVVLLTLACHYICLVMQISPFEKVRNPGAIGDCRSNTSPKD